MEAVPRLIQPTPLKRGKVLKTVMLARIHRWHARRSYL